MKTHNDLKIEQEIASTLEKPGSDVVKSTPTYMQIGDEFYSNMVDLNDYVQTSVNFIESNYTHYSLVGTNVKYTIPGTRNLMGCDLDVAASRLVFNRVKDNNKLKEII